MTAPDPDRLTRAGQAARRRPDDGMRPGPKRPPPTPVGHRRPFRDRTGRGAGRGGRTGMGHRLAVRPFRISHQAGLPDCVFCAGRGGRYPQRDARGQRDQRRDGVEGPGRSKVRGDDATRWSSSRSSRSSAGAAVPHRRPSDLFHQPVAADGDRGDRGVAVPHPGGQAGPAGADARPVHGGSCPTNSSPT